MGKIKIDWGPTVSEKRSPTEKAAEFALESLFVGPRSVYLDHCLRKIGVKDVLQLKRATKAYYARGSVNSGTRSLRVWLYLTPQSSIANIHERFNEDELELRFAGFHQAVEHCFNHRKIDRIEREIALNYYEKSYEK